MRMLLALVPIAIGHAAAVALVVAAVAFGLRVDGSVVQAGAGALLAAALAVHLCGGVRNAARQAAMVLGSFLMASAHGAGLMLVPALAPLCAGDPSAGAGYASGPMALALGAAALHMAAMLGLTAAMAAGLGRAVDAAKSLRVSGRPTSR